MTLREMLQTIHDEADHICGTEAVDIYEVARADAMAIKRLATDAIQQVDAAPELAEALHDVLAYYAPEALECDDWVLSGNTQTDAILRAARAALLKAGVKL